MATLIFGFKKFDRWETNVKYGVDAENVLYSCHDEKRKMDDQTVKKDGSMDPENSDSDPDIRNLPWQCTVV